MNPTPFDLLQRGLDGARRLQPAIERALLAHGGVAARGLRQRPEVAWQGAPSPTEHVGSNPAEWATYLLCQGFTLVGDAWHDFLAAWLAADERSPWAHLPASAPAVFRRLNERFGVRPELELHWRDFDGGFVTTELERLRGWHSRAALVRQHRERFSDDSLARKRAQLSHAIGFVDEVGRQLDALLHTARLLRTLRR